MGPTAGRDKIHISPSLSSAIPPQTVLSSFLSHPQPALHTTFLLPVCIFLSSSSFTLKLPLQPQLAFRPASPPPISHALRTSPCSFFCCRRATRCWKTSSSAMGGGGRLRRAGGTWRGLQRRLLHARGCGETRHRQSALPSYLEDFFFG